MFLSVRLCGALGAVRLRWVSSSCSFCGFDKVVQTVVLQPRMPEVAGNNQDNWLDSGELSSLFEEDRGVFECLQGKNLRGCWVSETILFTDMTSRIHGAMHCGEKQVLGKLSL